MAFKSRDHLSYEVNKCCFLIIRLIPLVVKLTVIQMISMEKWTSLLRLEDLLEIAMF